MSMVHGLVKLKGYPVNGVGLQQYASLLFEDTPCLLDGHSFLDVIRKGSNEILLKYTVSLYLSIYPSLYI